LYNELDKNSLICVLPTCFGVTQVQFSPNGLYLFTGGRKSNHISCWDIRNTGQELYQLPRVAQTNQRISFDIHSSGKYLATGSQDNKLLLYDLTSAQLAHSFVSHQDAVSSCHFHPRMPFIVTGSGQRKFDLPSEYTDEIEKENGDNRIIVWCIHHNWIFEEQDSNQMELIVQKKINEDSVLFS